MKNLMKLDLQHFAESAGSTELPAGGTQQTQTPPAQQTQELAIDYEKLAQIVQGKQSVAEDSALRGYLKQQGLSKEQMDQAITTFKQQQAANTPDVNALQAQAAQAQADAQQAQIQAAATMAAVGLGIDAKTIPYVLKMADLSQVMGEDGKINDETLKTVLNKVLEDVPALKPAPAGQIGFVQVGASGGSGQQQTTDDALKKAFGL
ncbi:MAG: hypothetical protein ACLT0W_08685 [Clostridium sp.]